MSQCARQTGNKSLNRNSGAERGERRARRERRRKTREPRVARMRRDRSTLGVHDFSWIAAHSWRILELRMGFRRPKGNAEYRRKWLALQTANVDERHRWFACETMSVARTNGLFL